MKVRLKNGLTVICERWEAAPAVALNLWVKTGSRNERKEEAGISHLIEHMVFKGTERRGVGELAREVEASGGEINAFTSSDSTVYYITLPAPFSDWGLDLLAEAVAGPAMDAGELEREREVVLAEIRGGMDQPSRRLQNELLATCYRQHPYGRPVIGYERTLRRMGRGELRGFLRRWYCPSNMVLSVVGELEEKRALSLIERAFAPFRGGAPPRLKLRPEPPQRAFRGKLVEGKFHVAHLDLAFRIPHLHHPDIPALDVLGALLGQGEGSLLYREVKAERGLVDTISAYAYTPLDPGLLIVGSTLEPEALPRALEAQLEVIFRLRQGRAGEAELERAKTLVESDHIYQRETVQGRARALAYFEALMGGHEKEDLYLTAIRRVSSQDIMRVARCYLDPRGLSAACLLPRGSAPGSGVLRSAAGRAWRRCLTTRAPSRRETSVRRYLLPNGLTLLVKERAEAPLVAVRAAFLGGQRFERRETSGISNFVAEVLDRGT
ncbi:MAG: insulinase family protein, partial [Nitrospinota bacterium]